MRNRPLHLVLPTVLVLLPGQVFAQDAEPGATAPAESASVSIAPAPPAVTQHTAEIRGQTVSYTATAGTLPLVEEGDTTAWMFYTAYIRDGVEDNDRRPIMFSFNGGPSTASVWMHMGYTGPRRVTYDDEGFALRPPAHLEDNPHSVLDVTDIVYLDPIATGFSRMVPGEDPHMYHGVMPDIQSLGDFIRLYVTKNDRWGSPKFIIGESYGTTRASGLAGYLQGQHQIYLNGVILVSMTGIGVEAGDDVSYAVDLPHLTATAWYHQQLPAELQDRPLPEVLAEAETFALGDYLAALVQGHNLPDAQKTSVVQRVAAYTGLSPDYVESTNLRVSTGRFRKELLRDQRLTVGRLDSRYKGVDQDAAGDSYDHDPALSSWNGPFAAAVNQYLREELAYDTDLEYNIWGDTGDWDREGGDDVDEMLRGAMAENPYLKVLIQGGYFDGATTYSGAKYTISHLQPGGEFKDRFRFAWYPSGHMMYLRQEDLARANQDLAEFIRWALESGRPGRPVTTAVGETARP